MRIAIDDAMDIHGGKAVIDGPQNYLGNLYRSVPGRHHRRGRQHPDPQPDRVRAGCDPRASLSARRDERAQRNRSRKGLDAFDSAF